MHKDLRIGSSYTQASDVMRWNVGAGLSHKTLTHRASVRTDSLVTNNGNGDDSRRANLTGNFQRYLRNRYFWFASASAQTNDELGVDGRLLVSGGAGRYMIQRRTSELLVALGLVSNYENLSGNLEDDNYDDISLEGLLNIDWTVFKLNTPSSRVSARLNYFPSLSEGGRNHLDLKISLRQEFIKDLFWVVEAFGSHDSRPPPGAISGDDYGITTSLAYEW